MFEDSERVVLKIDGQEFIGWNDLEITQHLDSYSTAAFLTPFAPENAIFRRTFEPFSYKPIEVSSGSDLMVTGTMIDLDPEGDAQSRSLKVQGYASPGVLCDCALPSSMYPLEFNGLKLSDITKKVLEPFGLKFSGVSLLLQDAPFSRVSANADQVAQEFLTDLAKQRNFVVSNTAEGAVEYRRPLLAGVPVAALEEGVGPLTTVQAQFSPRSYFSEVTVVGTSKLGGRNSSHTEKNTFSSGLMRPTTMKADSTEAASLPQAAKARLGRMFGTVVSYSFTLPTWRTPTGKLWEPNQLLTLKAPSAMIYQPTPVLIRSIRFRQTKSAREAEFNVVLPGSFSGELPKVKPWQG